MSKRVKNQLRNHVVDNAWNRVTFSGPAVTWLRVREYVEEPVNTHLWHLLDSVYDYLWKRVAAQEEGYYE